MGSCSRNAYGELFNDQWRFAAGLQLDVFAPNLPTVLPFTADGSPIGNTIKGQVRVERFLKLGSDSQLTLQGALSEPLNSANTPDISWTRITVGRTWKDALLLVWESRARIGLLTQRPVEIGFLRRGRPASQDRPSRRTSATGCF